MSTDLSPTQDEVRLPKVFLFHNPADALNQIRSPASSPSRIAQLMGGPVVPKFFICGAISAFIGGAYLGVHLWLMLNGQMPVPATYAELRLLHILVQIYLFLGLTVLGFILQAAPRFLQVAVFPAPRSLLLIPLSFAGVALLLNDYSAGIGRVLLFFVFLSMFCSTIQLVRQAAPSLRIRFGVWFLVSLSGLAASTAIYPADPSEWLLGVWLIFFPVMIGTGQQFIQAFVNGKVLESKLQWLILLLYFVSTFFALLAWILPSGFFWRAAGGTLLLCLLVYTSKLQLFHRKTWWNDTVYPLVFGLSYLWALIACLLLAILGDSASDIIVHLFMLGWITPLVLVVSAQVLRNISGQRKVSSRASRQLLLLWQIVPLGRAGAGLYLPPAFSLAVASAASVVLCLWCFDICRNSLIIFRQQLR